MQQYNLVLVEITHQCWFKIIDGWNISSGPITHETKVLDVIIGFHTNKVISMSFQKFLQIFFFITGFVLACFT
jgi:hypothetical protein